MDTQGMLNEIRKTTDMGVVGIEAVVQRTGEQLLRKALYQQKLEYEALYRDADRLLQKRGGSRHNVPSIAKRMAAMSSQMRLMRGPVDSKIAGMMIEGNTKGMIKSYQTIRQMGQSDPETLALSRKLLDTELHNIEQMKKFL